MRETFVLAVVVSIVGVRDFIGAPDALERPTPASRCAHWRYRLVAGLSPDGESDYFSAARPPADGLCVLSAPQKTPAFLRGASVDSRAIRRREHRSRVIFCLRWTHFGVDSEKVA